MYIPSHFLETDLEKISQFIKTHPLGLMVANVDGELVGNHLPFIAPDGNIAVGTRLISHTAKANPIWKVGETKQKVLLVFSGYETYISPSSYATKKETHKVVPTYNYLSVHIHGTLSAIQDEEDKHHIVKILTEKMESSRKDPWAITDAPKDYIETMLANIVGVELLVEKIEAKWKVSQNRPARDRQGVIDDLRGNADDSNGLAMAREIEALGGLTQD
jgi:transcriptional regulator